MTPSQEHHPVSVHLLDRLQSVARLSFRQRSEHISPLLSELHWLRVSDRIRFRLCSGVPLPLGTSPSYLADSLYHAADVDGRRHLRSANSVSLVVPSTRRSTIGDRDFPVAAARAWNELPTAIKASPSLFTFRKKNSKLVRSRPVVILRSAHKTLTL